ncbi:recombination exonuclease [Bacillus phage TsarBomba]|uniref:Exonuclease II n=1 Tax=Bacillus phage TsarBomba TaxID=1690456 RepID=A0A0K2D090_9CAUD|nr:recombination exonuclease [Bacillus phage TsarBomba]ALA13001.1 exonuclease II [Bacillus phage TsarBomba]
MGHNLINFSDFHLHNFEDYAKPMTYNFFGREMELTDRLVAQIETLNKIFAIAHENDADILFDGDFFHARNRIPTLVFNLGFDTIYENMMRYPNINMYMIVGNHDQKDNSPMPEHSLRTFRTIPRVTILDDFKPVHTGSCMIYPVSYSDDIAMAKTKIKEFAEHAKTVQEPTILVGHLGVDGSETGRYSHRLEGAFQLGDLYPHVFTYVALGHYHKRQFLGGTDNTFYSGNPLQASFSDEGQDKGVFHLNVETIGKPEFIPIENKKFITLDHIPENIQEIVDNNYVRLILPQELATEVAVFKENTDNVRLEIKKEYHTETRINIAVTSSEKEIVEAYAKEYAPEIVDLALDILKEAMEK